MTPRAAPSLGPVRTCIGCRQRAAAAELLRVVVAPAPLEQQRSTPKLDPRGPVALLVVPDPRSRAPGRGAWLHPDPDCVRTAERRRAFARALRVPAVDPTPVVRYVVRASTPGSALSVASRQEHSDTPNSRK